MIIWLEVGFHPALCWLAFFTISIIHFPVARGLRRRIFIRCDIRLAVGMVARIMAPRENNVYVSLGQ